MPTRVSHYKINSCLRLSCKRQRLFSLEYQSLTMARIQSGSPTAFCCGKLTQMVVAPPAAHTTPGSATFSIVAQLSKVVRPGSLTYIFSSTSSGYSNWR